ncbi:MAG: Hint domain-containing protein [Roseovarius sp.]
MADYSIHVLGESQITVTGGKSLDGVTQGDGSHLVGETITIDTLRGQEIHISDGNDSDIVFADNDGNQTLDGDQVIDGVSYRDGAKIEAEYRFTLRDETTGEEYEVIAVNIVNSSPAYGTIEALAFVDRVPPKGVPLKVVGASEGPNNNPNNNTAVEEQEIAPICFAAGTLIDTPEGPREVEMLEPGASVRRADGTTAVVRRAFRRRLGPENLERNPKLRPVRIAAGALGEGLPRRELRVSRQHRMLVSSRVAERMFGAREVLIPAIRLVGLPGVEIDETACGMTYVHLVFDRHEVILAEGAPSESLFLGPQALKALDAEVREEILAIFPQLADEGAPEPARLIPTVQRQKSLVTRHLKNGKPVLETFREPA